MKNVWIFILVALFGAKSFGQVDVIFVIDNTSSITNSNYDSIQNTIEQITTNILQCNNHNKVTVVHIYGYSTHIESDFDDDMPYFERRFTGTGVANVGRGFVTLSHALDNINDSNIISVQKVLHRTPGNSLIACFFTDANRGTDLLEGAYNIGDSAAFINYTNFKNNHSAKIMMFLKSLGLQELNAAAGVASVGGPYNGTIESYEDDPDGMGQLPRYLWSDSDFHLNPTILGQVYESICNVPQFECPSYLTISYPNYNMGFGNDYRQAAYQITANNILNNGTTALYHAGDDVVLKPSFYAASGSNFHGYIEGCSDNYQARIGNFDEDEREETSLTEPSNKELSFFNIAPNPANSIVSITTTEAMRSVIITSQDGKTLYSRAMPDKITSIDIPVGTYANGIYTVTVATANGKIQTKKLVKN